MEARRRVVAGGLAVLPADTPNEKLYTVVDTADTLAKIANLTLRGQLDYRVANSVTQTISVLIGALGKIADTERLDMLNELHNRLDEVKVHVAARDVNLEKWRQAARAAGVDLPDPACYVPPETLPNLDPRSTTIPIALSDEDDSYDRESSRPRSPSRTAMARRNSLLGSRSRQSALAVSATRMSRSSSPRPTA